MKKIATDDIKKEKIIVDAIYSAMYSGKTKSGKPFTRETFKLIYDLSKEDEFKDYNYLRSKIELFYNKYYPFSDNEKEYYKRYDELKEELRKLAGGSYSKDDNDRINLMNAYINDNYEKVIKEMKDRMNYVI